jgi:catalase
MTDNMWLLNDEDLVQAGDLYRLMSEDAKARIVDDIAAQLSALRRSEISERAIENFREADASLGENLARRLQALQQRNG